METILDYDAAGNLVDSQAYTYDDNGRVASELDGVDGTDDGDGSGDGGDEGGGEVDDPTPSEPNAPGATSYTYDDAGRLTSDGTTTYAYDAAGNRTGGGYVVGTGNELLSDGTWNYTYDAAGDRVGKTDPATGVSWTYTYDTADRLTSGVERNSGGAVVASETNVYDVFGDRIQGTSWTAGDASPTIVRQAYDGPNAWADFNADNQLATRYVFGDRTDQILARESAAGPAWYLTDRLGSVRDIVGTSGTVLDHLDYDPSGNVTVETNAALGDRFKFTAREYDAATGLCYNRARWYDSTTSVWTTPDPSNLAAGDPNVYRYAAGDPVDFADPSGLEGWGTWLSDTWNVASSAVLGGGKSLLHGGINVATGIGHAAWDVVAVPIDFGLAALRIDGTYSYYGEASENALRAGVEPPEITMEASKGIVTFGFYNLGKAGIKWFFEGNSNGFQETSGGVLTGSLAMYAGQRIGEVKALEAAGEAAAEAEVSTESIAPRITAENEAISGAQGNVLSNTERAMANNAKLAEQNIGDVPSVKTGAATLGKERTLSGWSSEEGFLDSSIGTAKVLELSKAMEHPLPRAGAADQGVPGQYYASHAEKQMAALRPNEPISVSKEMCPNCISWFQRLAQYRNSELVVAEPKLVRVFRPDGTIVEIPR